MIRLLDSLAIPVVAVVGWSAGGLYSQVFAARYPDRVRSLTLISSAIPFFGNDSAKMLPPNWKFIRMMNRFAPFLSKSFFRKLSKQIIESTEKTIEKSIKEMTPADRSVAAQPHWRATITKGALEAYHNQGLAVYYDAAAMMDKWNIPAQEAPYNVYIWQGDQDNVWTV